MQFPEGENMVMVETQKKRRLQDEDGGSSNVIMYTR